MSVAESGLLTLTSARLVTAMSSLGRTENQCLLSTVLNKRVPVRDICLIKSPCSINNIVRGNWPCQNTVDSWSSNECTGL